MTLPRTVADVLTDHVVFEVECIDRMYCNVYVPQLQHTGGLLGYIQRQLGCRSPRPPRWGRSPTRSARRCAASPATSRCRGWTSPRANARTTSCTNTSPGSTGRRGCCSSAGRRRRPRCFAPNAAATRPASPIRGSCAPPGWSTSSTSRRRRRLRPVLPQVLLLLPLQRQAVLNGHEWAKRQANARPESATPPLTTGSPPSPTRRPPRLQAICDRLGPGQIDALLASGSRWLPHPFTRPTARPATATHLDLAGQFSLTQVLDRPVSGRFSSNTSSAATSTRVAPTRSA